MNAQSDEAFQKNILVIKYRDGINPALVPMSAAIKSKVHRIERVFTQTPSLNGYHYLLLKAGVAEGEADQLLESLRSDPLIEFASFEPRLQNAVMERPAPSPFTAGETPDFENTQFYLEDAPRGVGARKAWTIPGGDGKGVRVADIEIGWQANHEDFAPPFWIGANFPQVDTDHGTAVWGIIAGKKNGSGVTGIVPAVEFGLGGFREGEQSEVDQTYTSSFVRMTEQAISKLQAGDLLIIEQHMNGPDMGNYSPVEYWKPIFDILKVATDKGILCLEAAGNGGSNLDGPAYQGAFDLKIRDSGCILVGAANPSLHWLYFSNYGSRVDAFGFGQNVTSTGYGDLFNSGVTRMYTRNFSGTSSATPIVTGAVAAVAAIARAQGKTITPAQMRRALRETGTPLQGNASHPIGKLPNIEELIKYFRL